LPAKTSYDRIAATQNLARSQTEAIDSMKKKAATPPKPPPTISTVEAGPRGLKTLAIDIGGTGIKAAILDEKGAMLTKRERIKTPGNATPKKVLAIIGRLAKKLGEFDRASAGFPGVIKKGIVYSAPNLGKGWKEFDLEGGIRQKLNRPARVANDADVQGLGSVTGKGDELVITLGTGFGSVLFVDGHRIHLELGHHPFHKGKTYEDELGIRALRKKGKKKWNEQLQQAIAELSQAFNYDHLYIGGGNTEHIDFKLPPDVTVVSNTEGLLGGIKLWAETPATAP
jgi:polyphosphate glucokinase